MADPTERVDLTIEAELSRNRDESLIETSEALVLGGFVDVEYGAGTLSFSDAADNMIPAGYVERQSSGDNDSLTGDATVKAIHCSGRTLKNVSVTGASAITDKYALVWATDGQTLTLTRQTTGLPMGFVKDWISTTYCDVTMFSIAESIMWGYIARKETVIMGMVGSMNLGGTSAVDLLSWTAPKHGKILTLHARAVNVDDGIVAGDQDLNLEIGTTNLTGGVLNLVAADISAAGDIGVAKAATAITAANEFHEADVITLEMAASGTGFTDDKLGLFQIELGIEWLPGA